MVSDYAIRVEGLNKSFGEVQAVNDLSLKVKRGELFAFLGVNGAGKSTTISIICRQLKADSGEVYICGENIKGPSETVLRSIGVVFQSSVLDRPLTVYENLKSRAALYGIKGSEFKKRLSELSSLLGLDGLMNRTLGKLSGGQLRRIDIARALIHSPDILILDEPTTGLDPQTRHILWQVVSGLRKTQGMTVFLTTHYMEEAADADYVVILDSGRIVAEGTPLELKNRFTGDYITLYGVSEEQIKLLSTPYEAVSGGYRVTVKSTSDATKLITENPSLFTDYEITKGKMDDVFLRATGKSLTEQISSVKTSEKKEEK